jgi:hypothetical protein
MKAAILDVLTPLGLDYAVLAMQTRASGFRVKQAEGLAHLVLMRKCATATTAPAASALSPRRSKCMWTRAMSATSSSAP